MKQGKANCVNCKNLVYGDYYGSGGKIKYCSAKNKLTNFYLDGSYDCSCYSPKEITIKTIMDAIPD